MISFHGDSKIKEKYLARVKRHREADNLVRGIGWENGRGCAVGCTLENYDHKAYETELGVPEWLARVEDTLFEGMSKDDAMEWPERFLKAIPIGVDLEKVKAPFLIFVLESALETFDHAKFPECKKAIDSVIDLYRSGETNLEKYRAAACVDNDNAAARAAAYTTRAARAAAYTARAAARTAAYAARAACVDNDNAAARAAAYAACAACVVDDYKKNADKLIEIFDGLATK